jgi:hypothetical protein
MEINKKKLYRVANKIKELVEIDLEEHLEVRFHIIDKKTMKKHFGDGAKGYFDGPDVAICVENIINGERLFHGFIKTVAHELRHAWQDDREKIFSKIRKKYINKAKAMYPGLRSFKSLIRREADAIQYEEYFFKNYSKNFRKF